MAKKISQDVLAALSTALCSGSTLQLQGQLDRKMYLATAEVIEAAGGKWDRKAKVHLFPGDAAEAIDQIILAGEIVKAQDFGFFETPRDLAQIVVDEAGIEAGMVVLEPSAGKGRLAIAAKAAGADVMCIELQEKNAAALVAAGFSSVVVIDFLAFEPNHSRFDRVVMNPPFANRADIKHIMHAAKMLKPGGRLVAIASASVLFRQDRLATEFRAYVQDLGGTIHPLPEGSFKESGTMVNTAMVIFDAR